MKIGKQVAVPMLIRTNQVRVLPPSTQNWTGKISIGGLSTLLLCFFAGIMLSILGVYLTSYSGHASAPPSIIRGSSSKQTESSSNSLNEDNAKNNPESKSDFIRQPDGESPDLVAALFDPSLPQGKRIVVLQQALRSGSLEALQVIRSEFVEALPNYTSEVYPQLQQAGLESLLKRFGDLDWQNWQEAATALDGQSTGAYTYVQDVRSVNLHLGRFLFTAGYFFSEMYQETARGSIFDETKYLRELDLRPAAHLSIPLKPGETAGEAFDFAVLESEPLRNLLDVVRGRLFRSFVNYLPSDDKQQIALLFSLNPSKVEPDVIRTVTEVLDDAILQDSSFVRDLLVQRALENSTLEKLGLRSDKLRRRIALLFIASAFDHLRLGDRESAKQLAEQAENFEPGLEVNEDLVRALNHTEKDYLSHQAARTEEEWNTPLYTRDGHRIGSGENGVKVKASQPEQLEDENVSNPSNSSGSKQKGGSAFGIGLIVPIIGALLFCGGVIIYWLRRRDIQLSRGRANDGEDERQNVFDLPLDKSPPKHGAPSDTRWQLGKNEKAVINFD